MIRRTEAIAAVVAWAVPVLLVTAGCGAREEEPRPGGTLTLALRDSFETFDPAQAWDPLETPFLHLLFEGLVAFDDSGRVSPACASRWEVSEDGRRVRFELRSGLRYADGSRIHAQDFRRGLERLFRAPPLRSPGAPQFASIEGALRQGMRGAPRLGVEIPDDRTVVVKLAWPDPYLLEKLAQPRYAIPVPAAQLQRLGRSYGVTPATNGPYRLERRADGTFVFVRSRHYSPANPLGMMQAAGKRRRALVMRGLPDSIRVLTGVTARRALLGIESGRVDLLWPLPREYRDRLVKAPTLRTVRGSLDPPVVWYLALNAELAPTARRDARRAIAFGVNRQLLGEALGSVIQPWRSLDVEGREGGAPGYDPDQSRAHLAAARYLSGLRLPVTVPRASRLAGGLIALTPGLARGAIQVDDEPLSRADWSQAILTRRGGVAFLVPWQAPSRDGFEQLASLFLNRGLSAGWGGNLSWYRPSSAFDSLLVRGLREDDPIARRSLREQVTTLLDSDLPLIPLARVEEELVHRPDWEGVRIHPRYGLDLRSIWKPGPGAYRRAGSRAAT